MRIAKLPSALGKGLIAGFAGTVAMTVSSTIEMKVRGRKGSSTPVDAASKVMGVTPVGEEEKRRFGTLVHMGYGTALGVPRGLLGMTGLPWPAATAVHYGAVWGAEAAMLPKLRVTPPVTQWGGREIAIDLWHHAVYALGAGVAYLLLDRAEQREDRLRYSMRARLAERMRARVEDVRPRAEALLEEIRRRAA